MQISSKRDPFPPPLGIQKIKFHSSLAPTMLIRSHLMNAFSLRNVTAESLAFLNNRIILALGFNNKDDGAQD